MKKKTIIVSSIVVVAAIIIIGVLVGTAQMRRLRNNIDSGHKYLIEDYWRETTVSLNKDITALRKLAKEEGKKQAFMQKVYDAMVAEDYEKMCEIDSSDEADEVAKMIEGNNYVYIPSGTSSGIGAVLCKNSRIGNFYYYGDIVNGIKSGNGTAFRNYRNEYNPNYRVMTGHWNDNKPNGQNTISTVGTYFMYNLNLGYKQIESGNMVNGLWNGYVDNKVYCDGDIYELSYEATMGNPTVDKGEEYYFFYKENAAVDNSHADRAGYGMVYAYDENRAGHRWVVCTILLEDETLGWFKNIRNFTLRIIY